MLHNKIKCCYAFFKLKHLIIVIITEKYTI